MDSTDSTEKTETTTQTPSRPSRDPELLRQTLGKEPLPKRQPSTNTGGEKEGKNPENFFSELVERPGRRDSTASKELRSFLEKYKKN